MEVMAADCVAVNGQPFGVPVLVPDVKKTTVSWEGSSWVGSAQESASDCGGMLGRECQGEDIDVLGDRTSPAISV